MRDALESEILITLVDLDINIESFTAQIWEFKLRVPVILGHAVGEGVAAVGAGACAVVRPQRRVRAAWANINLSSIRSWCRLQVQAPGSGTWDDGRCKAPKVLEI